MTEQQMMQEMNLREIATIIDTSPNSIYKTWGRRDELDAPYGIRLKDGEVDIGLAAREYPSDSSRVIFTYDYGMIHMVKKQEELRKFCVDNNIPTEEKYHGKSHTRGRGQRLSREEFVEQLENRAKSLSGIVNLMRGEEK